jgi:hypothetical protein
LGLVFWDSTVAERKKQRKDAEKEKKAERQWK